MRRILIASIAGLLLIGGLVAYAQRVTIREWFESATRPALPREEAFRPSPGAPSTSTGFSAWKTPTSTNDETDGPEATDDGDWLTVKTVPGEKLLAVPFIPQAPRQIWDPLHEEACEEASMLMIRGYYDGERGAIASSTADARVVSLVDFETTLGYGVDVTAEETVRIIEKRWPDLDARVVPMDGVERVKQYIANGIPVIIPADGKTLPNPNFRNGGPVYHMLVVKGYTADQFITNDPGTRKGESFLYTYDGLLNAVHDWNGGDVKNGARVMVVVKPRVR